MQQQISVVTIGTHDLTRSKRFYIEGFGWSPVFENDEIIFYQMNGLMLGTFLLGSLETDMNRRGLTGPAAFALGHNVPAKEDVEPLIDKLLSTGGTILRPADAPPHGGFRGYVADPDDHAWEIAWNDARTIDDKGLVTFGL